MSASTYDRLVTILREHTEPARIVPGAKLMDDLGLDSLDLVEIIFAAEEEFRVEFTDDQVEGLAGSTVDELVKLIDASVGNVIPLRGTHP